MSKIYSEDLYIKDFYCDRTAKLSIPMIAELAIASSIQQTAEMGIGMKELHAIDRGWVLLQYDIQINRRPDSGEKIRLTTDPKKRNQFFALRVFDFYDADGNLLIHIDSLWAMINLKRRRLVSLLNEFVDPLNGQSVEHLEKLPSPNLLDRTFTGSAIAVEEVKSTYFDIDTNQHVNNSNYLKYFLLPIKEDFLLHHEAKRIIVKYTKEILEGQTVASKTQFVNPLTSIHEISDDSVINATAEIEWR
ncbi:acyl-[acyl-carrier-protein] thioesterase [Oenococcus kitaharae]|uniref:acyl-[acyl-carrier-protein] thioesterase n=2 Tax=Lactobacillaceae TaxID=33958 RepID=UPI0021E8F291|nr:acyl-ACP thioesterase domain-containing protein [Oenococcus kitaharae]MCV3296682.1 thioesterase [Oenococcus kitaharae]